FTSQISQREMPRNRRKQCFCRDLRLPPRKNFPPKKSKKGSALVVAGLRPCHPLGRRSSFRWPPVSLPKRLPGLPRFPEGKCDGNSSNRLHRSNLRRPSQRNFPSEKSKKGSAPSLRLTFESSLCPSSDCSLFSVPPSPVP